MQSDYLQNLARFVLFRLIKKRSFNLLRVLYLQRPNATRLSCNLIVSRDPGTTIVSRNLGLTSVSRDLECGVFLSRNLMPHSYRAI